MCVELQRTLLGNIPDHSTLQQQNKNEKIKYEAMAAALHVYTHTAESEQNRMKNGGTKDLEF